MLKDIATPKKKSDWVCKWLRLNVPFLPENVSESAKGGRRHVWIARRMNAMETQNSGHDVSHWGKVRVLRCQWRCPACNYFHSVYIPESWIAEGKAVFVEVEA